MCVVADRDAPVTIPNPPTGKWYVAARPPGSKVAYAIPPCPKGCNGGFVLISKGDGSVKCYCTVCEGEIVDGFTISEVTT